MMPSKHRILKTVGAVLVLAAVAGAIYANRMKARLEDYLRQRTITTIEQRFDGDVEFHNLQITLFPHIVFRGDGLTLRQHGRTGVPPLIRIKTFWTEVALGDLLRRTHHVGRITLEGLTIVVPPHQDRPANPPPSHSKAKPYKVVVDEIVANGTELDMLLSDPNKPPRVFQISRLTLHGAGMGQAMSYRAILSNPVPAGEIQSHGDFGPWQVEDPSSTPLNGDYTFSHADLSTIHGLGGILSSKGKFSGLLERIDVYGETDTPDFNLGISGHPVPLKTQFHAIVDGTNGNTMLDNVHATLAHSKIEAHGGILRVPGEPYREVVLDAVSKNAQLADMLRLALKTEQPPMTGVINFQTRIDIPPRGGVVADRLKLDGKFNIASAHFSQLNIQKKVAELSRRGRGQAEEETDGSVASNFSGEFSLRDAVMKLSNLAFDVPGASVNLDGTYALHGEAIDFTGKLKLQARISQLVTGWKSVLLRPFDPLFEKDGAGTELPITVTGTGSNPQFGIDFHHLFHHSPGKPPDAPEPGSVAERKPQ
jgi:hypothetical protein